MYLICIQIWKKTHEFKFYSGDSITMCHPIIHHPVLPPASSECHAAQALVQPGSRPSA